jgi:hypothetical protein
MSHFGRACAMLAQDDKKLPGGMRFTWQSFVDSFSWRSPLDGRDFSSDRAYLDHFNVKPSKVCDAPRCRGLSRYRVDCGLCRAVCVPGVRRASCHVSGRPELRTTTA